MRNYGPRPRTSKARRGEPTGTGSHPGSTALDPVRMADREDCPHYLACLSKAASTTTRYHGQRSVCPRGCPGIPRPTSIAELLTYVAARHGTTAQCISAGKRWKEVAEARHEVWRLGNLFGWSDTELARATAATRQAVGEWLDKPRSER